MTNKNYWTDLRLDELDFQVDEALNALRLKFPGHWEGAGESVTTQHFFSFWYDNAPCTRWLNPCKQPVADNSATTPQLFPASVSEKRSQLGRLPTTQQALQCQQQSQSQTQDLT